jgi:hypothetical protein
MKDGEETADRAKRADADAEDRRLSEEELDHVAGGLERGLPRLDEPEERSR